MRKIFQQIKGQQFFLEFISFIFLLLDAVCFANSASASAAAAAAATAAAAAAAAAAAQQYAASSAQTGLWTKGCCCSYWSCCYSCQRGICCLCSTAAQVDRPDQPASQPDCQSGSRPANQRASQPVSHHLNQPNVFFNFFLNK